MLDPASSVPLYEQLAAELRRRIAAGHYPPGSCIPSEHELADSFRLGRPTVRQATEQLVREKLLERRRGSGTYVAEPALEVDLLSAAGTLASLSRTRLAVESHVLGPAALKPTPAGLRERLGAKCFHLSRCSAVAGTPVLLEEMWLDARVFPGLDRHDLEGRSLSQLAREAYLLRAERVEQAFAVVPLGATRAKRLDLPAGALILRVERTVDFARAPGALHADLYCRTDQVRFTQRLSLDGTRSEA